MAKPKTYTARSSIAELNRAFYERYDPRFLFNKAITLRAITTERDRFVEAISAFESYGEMKPYIDDHYFEALRAELHFIETHQFEAFFALMMAAFQDKPHWLYLTDYKNEQVKAAVERFLVGDVASLTGGAITTERDFVVRAIYEGWTPRRPDWDTNLDNHWWLLQRMAMRYLAAAGAAEYNAYKHGVRVMTGPSFWSLGDDDAPLIVQESPDSISYLDLRKTEEGYLRLYEVTKQFNPEESFFYLNLMQRMLDTMTKLRRVRLTGEPQEGQVHIILDRNYLGLVG